MTVTAAGGNGAGKSHKERIKELEGLIANSIYFYGVEMDKGFLEALAFDVVALNPAHVMVEIVAVRLAKMAKAAVALGMGFDPEEAGIEMRVNFMTALSTEMGCDGPDVAEEEEEEEPALGVGA